MKGPRGDRAREPERGQPLPELGRRLPGEGDGEDPLGIDPIGLYAVGDAAGQDPRLARTRGCQDAQGPTRVGDGVMLGGIETLEQPFVRHGATLTGPRG